MNETKSLIKQLNKESEKLNKENREIFTQIVVYVRTSNIKIKDAEEFLQQILDSFLNAENRNITIEEMLGTSDIKEYCKEIVYTYKSNSNLLYRFGDYLMYLGMIIIGLSLINFISQNLTSIITTGIDTFTLSLKFNLGIIIEYILISFAAIVFMSYIKHNSFKKYTKSNLIKEFSILWLFMFIIVPCIMFLDNILTFNLNIIIILIIGIPLYYIGQYLSEK